MRRIRVGALAALCAVAVAAATTGTAPAATPSSATASQAFVAGAPTAIPCGGSVDARVTVTTVAGTSGQATDVILLLDLSGSAGEPPSKFADLKSAAAAALDALDEADGSKDQNITGNRVGIVSYSGSTSTLQAPLGTSYAALLNTVNNQLPLPTGASPHDVGISGASAQLAASGPGRAIVMFSDGQAATGSSLFTSTTNAANAAKATARLVPIGIGTDATQANLKGWATDAASYQSGTPGPISKPKLVTDLGAAAALPTTFTLTETPGANFSLSPVSVSAGAAPAPAPATGPLQWTATLAGAGSATLVYRATRTPVDVFSTTNEVASTMSLAVTGGTATVTPPASLSINVLPCGNTLVAATTCTGGACSTSGTTGGQPFTLNTGAPPAGTSVVVSSLPAGGPPAGVCPGLTGTVGIEFDISPLTADSTFQFTIPKAQLGTKKWWQTEVCLGTNLRFITAIESLASLRPGSTLVSGGTLPSRWWGLLPSIPRYAFIPGLGFVRGPWITSRSQDAAGNAIVKFVVPFVPGSAPFTTDGKPGFDPKRHG